MAAQKKQIVEHKGRAGSPEGGSTSLVGVDDLEPFHAIQPFRWKSFHPPRSFNPFHLPSWRGGIFPGWDRKGSPGSARIMSTENAFMHSSCWSQSGWAPPPTDAPDLRLRGRAAAVLAGVSKPVREICASPPTGETMQWLSHTGNPLDLAI